MAELKLIKNSIRIKNPQAAECPQLAFDQIVHRMEKEEISDAKARIEDVLKQGTFDIRIITYFVYAHFYDEGVFAFKDILPLLQTVLKSHWDKLTPQDRLETHVTNSINWLFSQATTKLRYAEKIFKRGETHPLWEKSAKATESHSLDELTKVIYQFNQYQENTFAKSPLSQRISSLIEWISTFQSLVRKKETVPATKPLSIETASEIVSDDVNPSQNSPLMQTVNVLEQTLIESEPMKLFYKKLKTFEALIEKKEIKKAALCAADITSEIENFKVCNYFPALFPQYYALLAKNAQSISSYWNEKESVQWSFLENLYRSDIEAFVEW